MPIVLYRMGDALPDDVIAFDPEAIVHLVWEGIPDFSAERCERIVITISFGAVRGGESKWNPAS